MLTPQDMTKLLSSHGFRPSATLGGQTIFIYLNGEHLGEWRKSTNIVIVRDPRLAAWCHIVGLKYETIKTPVQNKRA